MIYMEGTWIEVKVITKSEALEPVSGIFYSLDCKGVAIEDPNDILGREQPQKYLTRWKKIHDIYGVDF
jgi:ribosomal protein L11 methyltransferase